MRVYLFLLFIGLSILLAPVSFGQSDDACERSNEILDEMLDRPKDTKKIDMPGQKTESQSFNFRWSKCSSSSNQIKGGGAFDTSGQDRAKEMKKRFERENRTIISQGCQPTEKMSEFEISLARRNNVVLCDSSNALDESAGETGE